MMAAAGSADQLIPITPIILIAGQICPVRARWAGTLVWIYLRNFWGWCGTVDQLASDLKPKFAVSRYMWRVLQSDVTSTASHVTRYKFAYAVLASHVTWYSWSNIMEPSHLTRHYYDTALYVTQMYMNALDITRLVLNASHLTRSV